MCDPSGSGPEAGSGSFNDDRHCFVCGEKNDFGLGLRPRGRDGTGSVDWLPERRHQGFEGVVHGGLISTLIDEAMAYAAMSLGSFCVTAEISVKFRRPVITGSPVSIRARVVEQRGRVLRLEASVTQSGEEKASGKGTFLQVPGERKSD